jgi:hypothetical protein
MYVRWRISYGSGPFSAWHDDDGASVGERVVCGHRVGSKNQRRARRPKQGVCRGCTRISSSRKRQAAR